MNAYYETLFSDACQRGMSVAAAGDIAATAFLDGKPEQRGKKRVTAAERHAGFWSADFLQTLPSDAWSQDSFVLALARYLSQDGFACPAIVALTATRAPETVQRAARYAGLVLRQDSARWREIEALNVSHPDVVGELVQTFRIFRQAHRDRVAAVERLRESLAALTALDLLAYASLYAFEHLMPAILGGKQGKEDGGVEQAWAAIEDILSWKLASCDLESLNLNERTIGISLRTHLIPFLFPTPEGPLPRVDLYRAFSALVDAQAELNSFIAHSAHALSYDDSIAFVRNGERLEIVEKDAVAAANWQRDGDKLMRLHYYWLYRGMNALLDSPETLRLISPAHLEANLQAFAKAMGTWLQLQEVYGVASHVKTETGSQVDVFRCLVAMELMTAFFIEDFLSPYHQHLQQFGNPWLALGRLAFGGFVQAVMQNRLPITWSDKKDKIASITPWTVSSDDPLGQQASAEAILDFWTSDWIAMAEQLRGKNAGVLPRLHERPMLKMGRYLFQLPWMVALQNNATAAVNNLRRLGARRGEARSETQRIEQRLGALFVQRGFQVLVGYELQTRLADENEVEEIDLLCSRDGQLLVLELKSTYLRQSVKDAWLHRTSTLRKAGRQLRRKVNAVSQALEYDTGLQQTLGLDAGCVAKMTAWIVDTSIECDHQRFDTFLKVSLEEVLIALRDDRHLLNDPDGLFQAAKANGNGAVSERDSVAQETLYPNEFSAERFVEVIESGAVWEKMDGKTAE